MFGPLIKTEHFKTKSGTVAHGKFAFYNEQGRVDSIQRFSEGLADGTWYYYNDTGKIYLQKEFIKGRLEKTIDFLNEDTLARRNKEANDFWKLFIKGSQAAGLCLE